MFRKVVTIVGTVGIFAGGIALISLMGALRPKVKPEEVALAPPAVFYTTAAPGSVTLDVSAQGEVRPRTDINLTAEVAGRIVQTSDAFVIGGAFVDGDLLVKIEDADYKAAVAGAKARVAQAEELLRREEAESDLARKDYEALGRDTDPSELTLRMPQLAQARAAYAAAKADYSAAMLDLERTEIRAPFDGRVRERSAGVGQFISPGAPIGRIFSTDVAEIRLPLTDADLAKLGLSIAYVETENDPGPPVVLSASFGGAFHEWDARIARTDGAIDPATRQIGAIAVVDDPYGAGSDDGAPLAMGLFVDARIKGRPIENAAVLPRTALYGRDIVYVIKSDDTLEERKVAVVSADRDTITISGGVASGERVVTSPLRGAKGGDKVTPTDPSDLPGATGRDEESEAVASAVREGAVR
ncbi:MAG TPA: efflux RND transporter periplasmic adaptor subunit [Parvularculaceae bacterium]|nr:efflux RND transporter periplasmic adaptor subunit [Parvularculaceae bacterium]